MASAGRQSQMGSKNRKLVTAEGRAAKSKAARKVLSTGKKVGSDASEAAGVAADVVGNAAEPAAAIAGEAAEDALLAVAPAADAVGEAAEDALNAATPVVEEVAEAVGEAAEDALNAAAPAAEELLDAATPVAEKVMNTGGKLAADVGKQLEVVWDDVDLDEAYTMTADATSDAVKLLVSGSSCACLAGLDILNMEIIRDFYQVIALFFAKIATASYGGIVQGWALIGAIFAFDINIVIPEFPIVYAFVFAGFVAVFAVVVGFYFVRKAFKLMPDDISDGLEHKGWVDLKESHPKTLKAIKYSLLLLVSIHLPVSRMAIQLLICADDDEDITSMKKLINEETCPMFFKLLSVIGILVVSVGVPVCVAKLIKLSKPRGSPKDPNKCFDQDGVTMMDFTNEMYNARIMTDVEQQCCPFVDLYKGFERRWAYQKVIVMIFKTTLAIVVIVCSGNINLQLGGSLACLAAYTLITAYSTPYVDHSHDKTELCAKFSLMANLALGLADQDIARIGIMVVMSIQTLVNGYYTLMNFEATKRIIQNCSGRFRFSDTYNGQEGPAHRIVKGWNIKLELRHRIWWPFWDGVLLKKYGETTAKRLLELKRITQNEGLARIKTHFDEEADEEAMEARRYVIDELEGVDCYWDGPSHDGQLDSFTKFGKMYIKRYPFECVMIWDDAKDHAFLSGSKLLQALVAVNQQVDVQAIRQVRQELRALAQSQSPVHFEFERDERRKVEDGTEKIKDAEGNEHEKTRYSTITVHMYYHNGCVSIGANSDKRMAAGFNVSITFNDGHGEGTAPHTGRTCAFERETAQVGAGELGFPPTFQRAGNLEVLLSDEANRSSAEANMQSVLSDRALYRQEMKELDDVTEAELPSSFWYKIYANQSVTGAQLQAYFSACPGDFASLSKVHAKGLDFVLGRIRLSHRSVQHAFWYCFFDDLWTCNKSMSCMKGEAMARKFNPMFRSSICYRIMPREELEPILTKMGLRRKMKLFSDSLMDLLYENMNRVANGPDLEGRHE